MTDSPPTRSAIRVRLENELARLNELDRRPSRYGDSYSYFLAGREIAHFHGDGRMDLRLTSAEIRRLRSEGPLGHQIRVRGPTAEWIEVHLGSEEELPYLLTLVELAIRANS